MRPTFAPAEPAEKAEAVSGPREETRRGPWEAIWFWKMTLPTTMEMAEPRLRMKPKVAVAVAMSRFWGS